jgi:hypothetical protein
MQPPLNGSLRIKRNPLPSCRTLPKVLCQGHRCPDYEQVIRPPPPGHSPAKKSAAADDHCNHAAPRTITAPASGRPAGHFRGDLPTVTRVQAYFVEVFQLQPQVRRALLFFSPSHARLVLKASVTACSRGPKMAADASMIASGNGQGKTRLLTRDALDGRTKARSCAGQSCPPRSWPGRCRQARLWWSRPS